MKVKTNLHGSWRVDGAPEGSVAAKGFAAYIPANDLLGLRGEATYLSWLEKRWGPVASRRRAQGWIRAGSIDELLSLAGCIAADKKIPWSDLARYMDTMTFEDGGTIVVPDFLTLAAWSISKGGSSGLRLVECPECQRPRFAPKRSSAYCYRPAPGHSTSCAQMHATERFSENRAEWKKEFKRIYARKLRGTVSEEEWAEWRSDAYAGSGAAPFHFVAFDEWKAIQAEGKKIARLQAAEDAAAEKSQEEMRKALLGVLGNPKKRARNDG